MGILYLLCSTVDGIFHSHYSVYSALLHDRLHRTRELDVDVDRIAFRCDLHVRVIILEC